MRALKITICLAGLLTLALPVRAADAPKPPAGTAALVVGVVAATGLSGQTRVLDKGDAIYAGDRVITGSEAYVRLGFLDGSSMVLRPNTEFAIESFRFQPGVVPALKIGRQENTGSQAFFRLVRGGLRAVSGLVGKVNREEYALRTPVATIGIRGTVFTTVACEILCAADPMVQSLLPQGETALGGTVSGVEQGSIALISNTEKTTTVGPSQFVLTTADGTHVGLPGLPGFMGSETWLNATQQAAQLPGSAGAAQSLSAAVSTVPMVGSLVGTVLIGVVALSTDMQGGEQGGSGVATTPPSSTSPTSTNR